MAAVVCASAQEPGSLQACSTVGTTNDAVAHWTYTATPQQDTYVADWTGSDPIVRSHHTQSVLFVSAMDVPPRRYVAYLEFELPALPVGYTPLEATLRLHRDDCPEPIGARNGYYEVHVVNEEWSAEELNDTYLPAYGPTLDWQFPYAGSDDWIAWDVTHAVSQWYGGAENHGLALDAVGSWTLHTYCDFSSAEGDHPPQLELTLPSHDGGTLFMPYTISRNP